MNITCKDGIAKVFPIFGRAGQMPEHRGHRHEKDQADKQGGDGPRIALESTLMFQLTQPVPGRVDQISRQDFAMLLLPTGAIEQPDGLRVFSTKDG